MSFKLKEEFLFSDLMVPILKYLSDHKNVSANVSCVVNLQEGKRKCCIYYSILFDITVICIPPTISGSFADFTSRFSRLLLMLLLVRTCTLSSNGSISFSTFNTSSFDSSSKFIVAPRISSPAKKRVGTTGNYDSSAKQT